MAVGDIDLDESKADLSEEVEIEPGVRTLALTQGRNRTEAVAMARDVVCELLDTGDWGFELVVETYPASPHDTRLDA